MSKLNIVDSQGWLEFFADGELAEKFSEAIIDIEKIIVPTPIITNVFRSLLQQSTASIALKAVAHMQLGKCVNLDSQIAMTAARFGVKNTLDSDELYLLAFAKKYNCTIWTNNSKLELQSNVKFIDKNLKSFRLFRS
jgi:toxin FitB